MLTYFGDTDFFNRTFDFCNNVSTALVNVHNHGEEVGIGSNPLLKFEIYQTLVEGFKEMSYSADRSISEDIAVSVSNKIGVRDHE